MPTIALVIIALQLVVVAAPFALQLVPMNRVIGLRVPPGPAAARIWYEANAHYARDLVVLGAVLVVLALLLEGMGFPPQHAHSAWAAISVGGFVLVTMEGRMRASEIAARTRAMGVAEAAPSESEEPAELAD